MRSKNWTGAVFIRLRTLDDTGARTLSQYLGSLLCISFIKSVPLFEFSYHLDECSKWTKRNRRVRKSKRKGRKTVLQYIAPTWLDGWGLIDKYSPPLPLAIVLVMLRRKRGRRSCRYVGVEGLLVWLSNICPCSRTNAKLFQLLEDCSALIK